MTKYSILKSQAAKLVSVASLLLLFGCNSSTPPKKLGFSYSTYQKPEAFFKNKVTSAKQNGKWGAVNKAREWVLEPEYDCVSACYDFPPAPPAPRAAIPYRPLAKDAVKKPRKQEWCRVDD